MSSLSRFFHNVGSEMRKVSWPKKKELTGYTITVILAVFFAVVDLGISRFMRFIFNL